MVLSPIHPQVYVGEACPLVCTSWQKVREPDRADEHRKSSTTQTKARHLSVRDNRGHDSRWLLLAFQQDRKGRFRHTRLGLGDLPNGNVLFVIRTRMGRWVLQAQEMASHRLLAACAEVAILQYTLQILQFRHLESSGFSQIGHSRHQHLSIALADEILPFLASTACCLWNL